MTTIIIPTWIMLILSVSIAVLALCNVLILIAEYIAWLKGDDAEFREDVMTDHEAMLNQMRRDK